MVKFLLKDGTKLKAKYSCLVTMAKDDMTAIKNLDELHNALTKQEFILVCLKQLGSMYELNISQEDLDIPTFPKFSVGIKSALSNEKSNDKLFVSFPFAGNGWKMVKVNAKTADIDIKRINVEQDRIADTIKDGIANSIKKRNTACGIPMDDEKKQLK